MADTGRTTRVGARVSPSLRGHYSSAVRAETKDRREHPRANSSASTLLYEHKLHGNECVVKIGCLASVSRGLIPSTLRIIRRLACVHIPLASPPLPLESNRISFRSTFFFLFHTCNEEVKRNDETSSVVRLQGFPPTGFTHLGRNFQDGLVLVVCNKLAIFAEAW